MELAGVTDPAQQWLATLIGNPDTCTPTQQQQFLLAMGEQAKGASGLPCATRVAAAGVFAVDGGGRPARGLAGSWLEAGPGRHSGGTGAQHT